MSFDSFSFIGSFFTLPYHCMGGLSIQNSKARRPRLVGIEINANVICRGVTGQKLLWEGIQNLPMNVLPSLIPKFESQLSIRIGFIV